MSTDYPRAMRVARRIRAGTVWIWDNTPNPWRHLGQVQAEGMGRELATTG
jgi:acyl-CoA reductase-like NAD-dependent aldehyde dehydrogenase